MINGYGNCKGCEDFTFLVGGVCVGCRRVDDLADDRPAHLRVCSCIRRGTSVTHIDSDCPVHGGAV